VKYRIESVTGFLTNVVSGWGSVECIAIDQRADALASDPYFALVLDVYHRGPIPSPEQRRAAFGDPGAFESALGKSKDRFFLDEVPVRVEYKSVYRIDDLLDRPMDHIRLLKNSGTYPLYRLLHSRIIYGASGWILQARERLSNLPSDLWDALADSFLSKMEHYLEDLGTALVAGDEYFRLQSEAGFMRYAAASLFMRNRAFEPSHREIDASLRLLPVLPEDFLGPWETFLREDTDSTPARRRELAGLMARAILSMR
jgi:hypothetical protein